MPTALAEKRLAKMAEVKAFYDANEKDWSAEVEQKWARLNSEYDAVLAECQAEAAADDKAAKAKAARARLDEINNHGKSLAGRDGGRLDDSADLPGDDDRLEKAIQERHKQAVATLRNQTLAMRGWMKVSASKSPSEEERLAARSLGQALSGNEFTINLMPTQQFREAQANGCYVNGRYRNALTTLTGSSGGFTIGETFLRDLESAMLYYGPMMQASQIVRTATGEDMHWPTATDTSNSGVQLPENTAVANQDPTFGRITWKAFKFSSKQILVPVELLEDTLFNLEAELARMLGERLGRIQNTKFTVGVGGVEPRGIITAASLGVTAASATAITFDEIISLEHSIDISRRGGNGTGYMFHDNILLAIRKLKDSDGRYLWQAGSAPGSGESVTMGRSGVADTLNAWPFWVNNDMASAITTTQKTILFGQLEQYKVRQVNGIRMIRLNERYADSDQVGFLAFVRSDGNLLNAGDNPVKYLQQA